MKRIAYAEEWLTTDDRVADLVLDYARALAQHDASDTVTVPVVDRGGVIRHAQFLIGPASQIIVVESDLPEPDSFDVGTAVVDLESRLRVLTPRAVAFDDGEDEPPSLTDL